MATWATRRKTVYLSGVFLVLAIVIGVPLAFFLHKEPTCYDGVQNQGERGIDCGGTCTRVCKADTLDLVVEWQRYSKVAKGVYNLLAFIQNPNATAEAYSLPYIFKVYDKNGILIDERKGSAFVPRGKEFALFEPSFQTGERVPATMTFEFEGEPKWEKSNEPNQLALEVRNKALQNVAVSPRLDAEVYNKSEKTISDVEAIALITDNDSNVIAFSRTVLDPIEPNTSTPIYFTWIEPFLSDATKVDILLESIQSK